MLEANEFKYFVSTVGDFKVLRYQIPGWDQLTSQQKNLLYCLYQASLYGRDIYYDQSFRFGLYLRRVLEAIYKNTPEQLKASPEWPLFVEYLQLFWINNGPHDSTSGDKTLPKFSRDFFTQISSLCPLPPTPTECDLVDILFGTCYPKQKTVNSIELSSTNFYRGLMTEQVQSHQKTLDRNSTSDPEPEEHGLNSQLLSNNGNITERRWTTTGMYGPALAKCVEWLEKALEYSETPEQRAVFEALIQFYRTGDLKDFIEYCKRWIRDTDSSIDMIHGFIETYDDPLGHRGSFESIVTVRDPIASKRIKFLQDNAQWFEDNSPVLPQHKRKVAKGIDARVVNVVIEAGNAAPVTPIGVNLPNAEWFRSTYGSKSINMDNIVFAYNKVSEQFNVGAEFYLPEVYARLKNVGENAHAVMVDMHEVIGHGSGQLEPGVGDAATAIGGVFGIIEECRADLVALYYVLDPHVVEIGLLPDLEAGKSLYDVEITNGLLVQLTRVPADKNTLTQTHMRDRQLIARWVFDHADGAVSKIQKDDKTFFIIHDYEKCRDLFGQLLREIQRIKSQGDRKAAEELVEKYATHIDPEMHKEAIERYVKFKMAPASCFIQPKLERNDAGEVTVSYPEDFIAQMLHYSEVYSVLPDIN